MPPTQTTRIEGEELQLLPQQEAKRPKLARQHAVMLDDIDEDEEVICTGQRSSDDFWTLSTITSCENFNNLLRPDTTWYVVFSQMQSETTFP